MFSVLIYQVINFSSFRSLLKYVIIGRQHVNFQNLYHLHIEIQISRSLLSLLIISVWNFSILILPIYPWVSGLSICFFLWRINVYLDVFLSVVSILLSYSETTNMKAMCSMLCLGIIFLSEEIFAVGSILGFQCLLFFEKFKLDYF